MKFSSRVAGGDTSTGSQPLPYLDLARGLAAFLVLAGHLRAFVFVDFAQVESPTPATMLFYAVTGLGHQAVMVFFVLSGFLIGNSVHQSAERNAWSLRRYIVQRQVRLWIVLIPALVITTAFDHLGLLFGHAEFYYGGLHDRLTSGPSTGAPANWSISTFSVNFLFSASKVGWLVLAPSNLLLLLALTACVLMQFQRTITLGRRIGSTTVVVALVVTLFPLGEAMLQTLERRFPPLRNCADSETRDVAGILLLGGSIGSLRVNSQIEEDLGGGVDRIRLTASLARAHPQALVLVSGGQTFPRQGARSEAEATADLLDELSVSPERIVLETASRTTAENALFAATQAGNARGRWLLVTSAFHMPRAVATFRKAGLDVIAAPTDWQVDENSSVLSFNVSDRLHKLDLAAKEYLGLLVYWLVGRTSELFPGPSDAEACA